jgi:hypothetical protein
LAGLLATAANYFSSSLLGEGEASLLRVTLRFDDLVFVGVIVNQFVFFITTTSTTDGSFCDASHIFTRLIYNRCADEPRITRKEGIK